jgi:outer membrane protein assembly factor BamB
VPLWFNTVRDVTPEALCLSGYFGRRVQSLKLTELINMPTFIVLFAMLFAGTPADNWERFRGPNGTGVVADKNIPVEFGANKNIVWKTSLEGVGNSSPIVWGNRLFLHATSKDGKTRSLLCIDTANGKTLWERSVPGLHVTIRPDSSFASSTPTTDGSAVFVSFWDGKNVFLHAFDFQGKKLWSKNLGTFNSQHGAGASPILYKDKLILAHDMDKDDFVTKKINERPSTLMAFNKKTGELLWESPRTAERTCYSAPFLLHKPGKSEPELVITSTTAVTGYDLANGAKLWEAKDWQKDHPKAPFRTVASPTLVGDVLCVCAGGDAGRYAIGLDLKGATTKTPPPRLWENRKDFPYVPTPLAHGEHIYFVNDAGLAGCYHARTGKREWLERASDAGFHASPLLIDGKIYAANVAGDVYVLDASPMYRLIARNELGEVIRATPAVAGGRMYVRGERTLWCVGK